MNDIIQPFLLRAGLHPYIRQEQNALTVITSLPLSTLNRNSIFQVNRELTIQLFSIFAKVSLKTHPNIRISKFKMYQHPSFKPEVLAHLEPLYLSSFTTHSLHKNFLLFIIRHTFNMTKQATSSS